MNNRKPKILFVEDDPSLGMVVKDYLALNGYEIIHCDNGQAAWDNFQTQEFDLCLLDIMLPKQDGYQLAEMIRKVNDSIPIIFLTAKANFDDKIIGFKKGADDYITKPFNIEELVLRIEVFLKRSQTNSKKSTALKIGNYTFEYQNLTLTLNTKIRKLTQREADVLHLLCMNEGNILKREDVLTKIWGDDDYFLGKSLDVFISKLRKYLKEDTNVSIQNFHSVGFKLVIQK